MEQNFKFSLTKSNFPKNYSWGVFSKKVLVAKKDSRNGKRMGDEIKKLYCYAQQIFTDQIISHDSHDIQGGEDTWDVLDC